MMYALIIAAWATLVLVMIKVIIPGTKKLIMYLAAIGIVVWYHRQISKKLQQ